MVIDMSERDNVYIITIATREEFAAKKCSLVAIYYNKEYADKMFDKLKVDLGCIEKGGPILRLFIARDAYLVDDILERSTIKGKEDELDDHELWDNLMGRTYLAKNSTWGD